MFKLKNDHEIDDLEKHNNMKRITGSIMIKTQKLIIVIYQSLPIRHINTIRLKFKQNVDGGKQP